MTVKWSGGGQAGASAAESAQIDASTKNIGLNSLRIAIGDSESIYEMVDGFGDAFNDTTGVNSGSSSNATHNSGGAYYSPTAGSTHSLLIQSIDEADSGGDDSGATDVIVDSTSVHTVTIDGATKHSVGSAKFDTSKIEFNGSSALYVAGSSDFGPASGGAFVAEAWVWPDNSSQSSMLMGQMAEAASTYTGLSWVIAYIGGNISIYYTTDGVSTGTPTLLFQYNSALTVGAWNHVAFQCDGTTARLYVGGIQRASAAQPAFFEGSNILHIGRRGLTSSRLYFTGKMEEVSVEKGANRYPNGDTFSVPTASYSVAISDMTLVSNTQTANTAPTNARAVVLYDPIDAATLNTDATLELSMDGGSTWSTPFTLTKEADYDANVQILTTNDLTLDSTSGTSILYRFKTLNNKDQRVHGVYIQWR